MSTHLDFIRTQKALMHSQTLLRGAGLEQLGAFMLSAYRLAQAECLYADACNLLSAAATIYSPDPPDYTACLFCGVMTRMRFGEQALCASCRNPSDGEKR